MFKYQENASNSLEYFSVSTYLKFQIFAGSPTNGKAYIFDCRYSTLCRQIVTDEEGRVQEFDFNTDTPKVVIGPKVKCDEDPNECKPEYGIDSVVAIPLDDWSLDLITPNGECVRKNGQCIQSIYPDAPDESMVFPFINQDPSSQMKPNGIIDQDANPLYIGT